MSHFSQAVPEILRSEGLAGLMHRIIGRLLRKPQFVNLYVAELTSEAVARSANLPPPLIGLEIREITEADGNDIEAVARFGFYGNSRANLLQCLADGQQCYVAKYQGQVISCCWRATGTYYDYYLKRRFDLDDDEEYLLGAYVLPEFRGKGILPYLQITTSLERIKNCPQLRGIAFVRVNNTASLRSIHKMGFRIVGRLGFVEVLGIRFQYLFGRDALPRTTRRTFLQISSSPGSS